jgi:hypothetical protein
MASYYRYLIKTTSNYLIDYTRKYGEVSPEERYILQSFTQQEIRSIEQAVSTYAKLL